MRWPTSSPDLGFYLHTIFCEHVCPYCDFAVEAVGRLDPELEAAYVDLLLRELDLALEAPGAALEGRRAATLYLGGGTPSLLAAASVERLIRRIREAFPGEPAEITLELNPGQGEARRAPEFRAAGVTRLSLGLQSMHDRTLKGLGRAHRAAEALAGLEIGLASGFESLSVDLIYGAPSQSEGELLEDLERLIELSVPHVSAYALTIESGTPFAQAHARGQLDLPSEEIAVRMGELVRSRLLEAGYVHYEISSFALPGHEAVHNQRYWRCEDVLGLGPSAASKLGRHRFQNVRHRARWQEGIEARRRVLEHSELQSLDDLRREALYLGFRRLEGISRADYEKSFGAPPEAWFSVELAELHALELIREQEGHLCLSERGILFADEVFLRFAGR